MKIEGRLARWLVAFGFRLLQLWGRTLRYEIDDRAGIVGRPVTENYIGALWHNRLLVFPLILRRFFPQRHGAALISASRDGDLLADAVQRFGYDVVRGSSSRLGSSAILQLTQVLAAGGDVVITPAYCLVSSIARRNSSAWRSSCVTRRRGNYPGWTAWAGL